MGQGGLQDPFFSIFALNPVKTDGQTVFEKAAGDGPERPDENVRICRNKALP